MPELTEKRKQAVAEIANYRNAVEYALTNLETEKDREERAVFVDEQLKQKHRDLSDYINNLGADRPQALVDKLLNLSTAQAKTRREREAKHAMVGVWQNQLKEMQNSLAFAEHKLRNIDEELKKVSEQIRKV